MAQPQQVLAQVKNAKEVQAVLVYGMLKYIEWPDESESGDFVVGVFGDDQIYEKLKIFDGKSKNGKKSIIKKLESAKEAVTCSVVYLGSQKSKDFENVKNFIEGKPILFVTDTPNLGQRGSHINFKEVDGKIKYELNKESINKSALKVSTQLTSLAINI